MQLKEKSKYEMQAEDFLQRHKITFSAKFEEYYRHFPNDKEKRDIYTLTLTRENGRSFSVRFGQSINHSQPSDQEIKKIKTYSKDFNDEQKKLKARKAQIKVPNAYDMLCCITKYSPGSLQNFCSEFGYDEDSKRAEKIYISVVEEWFKVEAFFTAEELEEIQEIY